MGHAYNPHTADDWKTAIKAAFLPLRKGTLDEPVSIEVCFFLPKPKAMKIIHYPAAHIKKPDTDNLLKAVMDALTDIEIWRDDSLVFYTSALKVYEEEQPGALIIIRSDYLKEANDVQKHDEGLEAEEADETADAELEDEEPEGAE
jgi:Holliday junction resolvase RusA-like endonuclease